MPVVHGHVHPGRRRLIVSLSTPPERDIRRGPLPLSLPGLSATCHLRSSPIALTRRDARHALAVRPLRINTAGVTRRQNSAFAPRKPHPTKPPQLVPSSLRPFRTLWTPSSPSHLLCPRPPLRNSLSRRSSSRTTATEPAATGAAASSLERSLRDTLWSLRVHPRRSLHHLLRSIHDSFSDHDPFTNHHHPRLPPPDHLPPPPTLLPRVLAPAHSRTPHARALNYPLRYSSTRIRWGGSDRRGRRQSGPLLSLLRARVYYCIDPDPGCV
ncbi:hypothetical protein C8Q77DRAFT_846062 [Trametes polyzona]|nr:hypothetical protein C8Q77DRAFT_846062 [Trametes polyzona]